MAANMYNRGIYDLMQGSLWSAGDYRLLLLNNGQAYSFNADHDYVNDLKTPTDYECSGTGYARKTLAGETAILDDTNDQVKCDATDPSVYSGANFGTVQAAVVFRQVTNDTDSPLICYLDGPSFPVTTNGGDLTIQFHADGVFVAT